MGESEKEISEGRWYTREACLKLGLRRGPNDARDLRDLGVDTTSTRLSYDQLLDAVAVLLGGHDREELKNVLAGYAQQDEASLAKILVSVGFGETAAKSYARRYRARLIAVQTAYPPMPQ